LKKEYNINNEALLDLLNFSDFRCNLSNKNDFQSPEKTLRFIEGNYNKKVYDELYSIETIKKLLVKGV